MDKFWAFVQKEIYHILRDKRTLIILFGMPIVQIMLFGFAITNEIKDANIAILDKSKDNVSTKITNKIQSSGYFKITENFRFDTEIEKAFQKGFIKQAIIFEADFAEKLQKEGKANVQIIADASDPNTSTTLLNYTQSIIQSYNSELNPNLQMANQIIPEVRMRYNPRLRAVYLFIPGLITIILMLVSAMMTSITITREKELGNMEVLLASPMKPHYIIIAKVLPYIALAFFNANMILLLGKYIFGVPVVGSLPLLLAETILFIITALSLGILISTKAKTQQVALMVSLMTLMLPTILLSGFIFPIENMPLPLQIMSNIIPAKWFLIIAKNIMLKGAGLEIIWKETLVLVGFTLLFISLSIKNFKNRLE